jgi:hypothetical protein
LLLLLTLPVSNGVFAQAMQEKFDSTAVAQIKDEGINRSQVMDILSYLSDIYGPRLTGSTGYLEAATWAREKLTSLGMENSHFEAWGSFGRGWELKHYSANVTGGQTFPLISYPKAWSPGTDGKREGEIIFLDAGTDSALDTYRGKLHGKFILIGNTRDVKAHFTPEFSRHADSTLLEMANDDPVPKPKSPGGRFQPSPGQKMRQLVNYHKWKLCEEEGAAGVLSSSAGDGGNMMFVQAAFVPNHPDTPFVHFVQSYSANAPKILPQINVGVEHFNRLVRMIKKGEHPKLELELDVEFNKADSVVNVIAEIPGTDLKDEVVMIGGHLDSWHGATGATDNGTGSAVAIEAMRILKTLNLKPRRTIRIGLWSGEEQGEFGSGAYVKQHFVEKGSSSSDAGGVKLSAEGEKFSVYFNNDYGTGKVRGVFTDGNEGARPVLRKWLTPFASMGASTLNPSPIPIGGTDHESFEAVGLPGFQFIQDDIEYFTRSWHSTTDLYERAQPEDLKQAAVIMAAFAYNAAMRDEKFPRLPKAAPQTGTGSH